MEKIDHHPRDFIPFLIKAALAVIVVILVGLLAAAIYFAGDILALIFIAYLISLGMNTPIDFLCAKCRLPRLAAAIISYVIILCLLTAGIIFIVPPLISQILELLRNFDFVGLNNHLSDLGFVNALNSLAAQFSDISKSVFSAVGTTFNQVFRFFTMLVISFHLAMDKGKTDKRIKNITKNSNVARIYRELAELLNNSLGGWLRGELLLMLAIGLVSYLGFLIIGVKFALALGILAGFLELIPTVGPIIAAIPAVVLAFSVSPITGVITLIFCIAIQQLENIFFVPKIMHHAAHVHPLISIVLILIGLDLFGVFGGLAAIPFYIVLRTFYIYFIRDQRHLASTSPS